MVSQVIAKFLELVHIDSPSGSEGTISHLIQSFFQKESISHTVDEYGNILACVNCSEHPPLVFACHLDTVAAASMVHPVVSKECICTDGSSALGADDKIAVALQLILAEHANMFGPFGLLFTVGEEEGLKGAKHLSSELYKNLSSSKVFIFDAGRPVGTAVIKAPCKFDIQITFHGKSAHAGVSPELGISAISSSALAISSMRLSRIDDDTTANIGSIHGNGNTNVVCDRVDLKMEIRSQKYAQALHCLEEIKKCCSDACNRSGGSYSLEYTLAYPEYSIVNSEALQLFGQACEACSIPFSTVRSGGGSDVNVLRDNGVDAILLGVGYKNPHSINECISLAEITRMLDVSIGLLGLAYQDGLSVQTHKK